MNRNPRLITEPRWKSYIVETKTPIFTPEQCQTIIDMGRSLPRMSAKVGAYEGETGRGTEDNKIRISHISWIPFEKLKPMYDVLDQTIQKVNKNHFGFEGMQLTELAQYTEYSEGQFYDWHMDNHVIFAKEPPVRKISMTCLLSPENEFEGGDLELVAPGKKAKLTQGNAIFFASFINHRVTPVIKGNRKSLVVWFGGPPLK